MTEVFRQTDKAFQKCLSEVRLGKLSKVERPSRLRQTGAVRCDDLRCTAVAQYAAAFDYFERHLKIFHGRVQRIEHTHHKRRVELRAHGIALLIAAEREQRIRRRGVNKEIRLQLRIR